MPPKLHKRVKYAVPQQIWYAIQERLQAEADSHCAGGGLDGSDLRALRPLRAQWSLAGNRDKHSFVCAGILWSDGLTTTYRWRLPYEAPVRAGGGYSDIPIRQVALDKATLFTYPSGARAGFGRRSGEPGQRSSASRPEVGRAFKRRGSNPRSRSDAP